MGIIRTSGSRQDLTVEGAGTVYINRQYYMGFFNKALSGGVDDTHNILLNNYFIIMRSLEMIVATSVFAMFHMANYLFIRYLARNKQHQCYHNNLNSNNWNDNKAHSNNMITKRFTT